MTENAKETQANERPQSFDLADFPVPTGREEQWRFTPIDQLAQIFDPSCYAGVAHPQVTAGQGVTASVVDRSHPLVGSLRAPGDRASVVAWDVAQQVTLVEIGPDADELPISIRYAGQGETDPLASHLVVSVAPEATARIVVEHTGQSVLNAGVEIIVGENADVEFVSLQEWDRTAVHTCHQRARIGDHGRLKHTVVTLGGALVRLNPDVEFAGEGAEVDMYGVYFTDSDQHHEHRLWVDHEPRHCRSRVTYKGALQGRSAHAVWIGDVVIGATADGTDSYELNRNLILNEGAKADSVPNLEILNGNIEGAGHASATGRFDDEQLFYLMSRGIDEKRARKLVVHGFFAEIVSEIGMPDIEQRLMQAIDEELSAGGAL